MHPADEDRYEACAPQDSEWFEEIDSVRRTHPDLEPFCRHVARLTKIAWILAEELDSSDTLGEVEGQTYGEYLWFFSDAAKAESETAK